MAKTPVSYRQTPLYKMVPLLGTFTDEKFVFTCGAGGLNASATVHSFVPDWLRNGDEKLLRHRAESWETAVTPMRLRGVNGYVP